MKKITLCIATAALGLSACADEALEPYFLTPIDVEGARFSGDIGEAAGLDIADDEPLGEREEGYLSVQTAGSFAGGEAMTIVSLSSWGRSLDEVLQPGTRLTQRWEEPDGARADEPPLPEDEPPAAEPPADDVTVDIVGCSGDPDADWYDEPASEVEVVVSEGAEEGDVVVDYTATFENDEPDLPATTMVTGRFVLPAAR